MTTTTGSLRIHGLLALGLLAILAACAIKDDSVFGLERSVLEVGVSGVLTDVDVDLTGPVSRTGTTTGGMLLFDDIPAGSYQVGLTPSTAFACDPLTFEVSILPRDTTRVTTICRSRTGSLVVYVEGVPGGATVTLTGNDVQRTMTVTANGHTFADLPAGGYTVAVSAPANFTCRAPTSVGVTVSAGGVAQHIFQCDPDPGDLRVSVSGLSGEPAAVRVTGTGVDQSAMVTAQHVFADLAPGDYGVTITPPAGFTCVKAPDQATHPVVSNQTTDVGFACSAVPPAAQQIAEGSPYDVMYVMDTAATTCMVAPSEHIVQAAIEFVSDTRLDVHFPDASSPIMLHLQGNGTWAGATDFVPLDPFEVQETWIDSFFAFDNGGIGGTARSAVEYRLSGDHYCWIYWNVSY